MGVEAIPATLDHYLQARLARVDPAARLVCVFDLKSRLGLEESVVSHGRSWPVLRYTGNDLAFRAVYRPGEPSLVWITRPVVDLEGSDAPLDVSSLADVLSRADAILDLSLTGVLEALVPGESWPTASLAEHGSLLSAHLPQVVEGREAVRLRLPVGAALDGACVRAIALHCRQPQIPADELLFRQDTANAILDRYITLMWGAEWDEASAELLREQAQHAVQRVAPGSQVPWLDIAPEGLARYLYLYRLLASGGLANTNNQLRGLGLLGFDPEPLEPFLDAMLARWERDASWRGRLIQQAEKDLTLTDVQRALDLLHIVGVEGLMEGLRRAEFPAVVYELAARLLLLAPETRAGRRALCGWEASRPALEAMPVTSLSREAQTLVRILDEVTFVQDRLASPVPSFSTLAASLDWYTQSGAALVELSLARASTALRGVQREDVHRAIEHYLNALHSQARVYLDQADHALAELIRSDLDRFLVDPRLSTNVLRDTVQQRRPAPSAESAVWIAVFDGMRWDTWQQVVKPRLLQHFELKEEKAYASLLPSWTFVARGGLLAAKAPQYWQGYRGTFTPNQMLLAARALNLSEGEYRRKLRFFSRMESDRTSAQLDPSARYPYNILVFNISDDNLHHMTQNLDALNRVVEELLQEIIDTLTGLVRPDDTLILASDHGFIELTPGDGIPIPEEDRWQRYIDGGRHPVNYRYIAGVDPPSGLGDTFTFDYRGMPEGRFTVAIGRKWFQRTDARGEVVRFAHGGLSFPEMVVPGAVMQLITEKRVEIAYADLPQQLEVEEGQELSCVVALANTGNQPACFELRYRTDTEAQPHVVRDTLSPGERAPVSIRARCRYQQAGGSTTSLHVELSYGPLDGGMQATLPREIPVTVTPQKGRVEISLGGLDDLER